MDHRMLSMSAAPGSARGNGVLTESVADGDNAPNARDGSPVDRQAMGTCKWLVRATAHSRCRIRSHNIEETAHVRAFHVH